MYLIPSLEWEQNLNSLLVSRDYEGKSSPLEYGINLSKKNMGLLEKYEFDKQIDKLRK